MDALDQLIRTEQEALDALRLQVAAQEAKVSALIAAASLRPVAGESRAPSTKGGKPKGAISAPWKNTLGELYAFGGVYPYTSIKACYDHMNGANLAIASVRDRVRSLVDSLLLAGDPDQGFYVTDAAAKKFGFKRNPPKVEVPAPTPVQGIGAAYQGFDDDSEVPF